MRFATWLGTSVTKPAEPATCRRTGVIRLFRAPWSTNCERVGLALAHKGLEAESVLIDYSDRSAVEEVSGQGLVPVIEDEGVVIADSRRILAHLDERYPERPLMPAGAQARARAELFCEWFDEVWKRAPNAIESELERADPDRALIERYAETMDRHLDLVEGLLAEEPFLSGRRVGAPDFVAYPFLKYARGRHPDDDELFHRVLDERQSTAGRPRVAAWVERVGALPRAYSE
jgi:glutathione S-transferase